MKDKVYKLKDPFEHAGVNYDMLTFKPLKGKHIKKIGTDPNLGDLLGIAAKVTGTPDFVFDEMSARDCMGAAEIIGDFLTDGQETGL